MKKEWAKEILNAINEAQEEKNEKRIIERHLINKGQDEKLVK